MTYTWERLIQSELQKLINEAMIAPDLRELYDSAKGFSTLESWMGPLSKRVMELIERVSKAEQENVALRAKVLRLVMARGRDPEVQP